MPARPRVMRHRREKPACTACDRIAQAPAPNRPIDCGIPGPRLLANVLVSKILRSPASCITCASAGKVRGSTFPNRRWVTRSAAAQHW